ncbi:MAG: alpha/beta hydrolase [Alphaproteobacteria bacterium]
MVKIIGFVVAGLIAFAIIAPLLIEVVCETLNAGRFKAPGDLVDIGRGRKLHLLCKGDAPGPTIVIEQGLFSPSILWWPTQDRVSKFARVCTYDRAGYLWSPGAGANRSIEDRVADLHALLTAAELPKPFVLVGHSYGGLIIRLYTKNYSDDVAGLVLVDSPHEALLFSDKVQAYMRQSVKQLGAGVIAARFGALRLGNPLFDSPVPGLSPWARGAMKAFAATPGFMQAVQDDMRSIANASAALRKPGAFGDLGDKPLIAMTHGIPFPPQAGPMEEGWREGVERLAKLSTNSEFTLAEKSNHQIFLDQPDLVVDAIKRVHGAARDHSRLK